MNSAMDSSAWARNLMTWADATADRWVNTGCEGENGGGGNSGLRSGKCSFGSCGDGVVIGVKRSAAAWGDGGSAVGDGRTTEKRGE